MDTYDPQSLQKTETCPVTRTHKQSECFPMQTTFPSDSLFQDSFSMPFQVHLIPQMRDPLGVII